MKFQYEKVKMWFTEIMISDMDLIIAPFHVAQNQHWTLVVADLRRRKIEYYDSRTADRELAAKVTGGFARFLYMRSVEQGKEIDTANFNHIWQVEGIPKQRDFNECGVFMLTYASLLARGFLPPLRFTSDDMKKIRCRIAFDVAVVEWHYVHNNYKLVKYHDRWSGKQKYWSMDQAQRKIWDPDFVIRRLWYDIIDEQDKDTINIHDITDSGAETEKADDRDDQLHGTDGEGGAAAGAPAAAAPAAAAALVAAAPAADAPAAGEPPPAAPTTNANRGGVPSQRPNVGNNSNVASQGRRSTTIQGEMSDNSKRTAEIVRDQAMRAVCAAMHDHTAAQVLSEKEHKVILLQIYDKQVASQETVVRTTWEAMEKDIAVRDGGSERIASELRGVPADAIRSLASSRGGTSSTHTGGEQGSRDDEISGPILGPQAPFSAKTSFQRYLMLEDELVGRKMKDGNLGVRLEVVQTEVRELRALATSQATTIQDMRRQLQDMAAKMDREAPTKVVHWTESSRYGIQGESVQGLFGQSPAAGPSRKPPMGKVILEPEKANAKREAEKEAFEFKAPTELATQPATSSEPATESLIPRAGDRPRTTVNESALGSDEGSMNVLLEAVITMQEGASVLMPEQREEVSREEEIVFAMEGVYEGRPQRLDTPEYRLEGVGIQAEPSTQELEVGPEEPMGMPQCHEMTIEASEAPSSPGSQKKKKRGRKSGDLSCFFCKDREHRALQCPKFLKDKASGRVTESGGKMYDRQGRIIERSADGGIAQLYKQNQMEMSE
ncbi:hypothetical protein CBR_g78803 [Chara braunii]|uniref:Ubiquitin-like protease family profile domain-containing protein n=1 Tax=Chara braunii TaxID=69332 RepID=A0A388KAC3_CHABU|nr:hypothetical protein CBR_g78803 [Chara braunii]|eukprot:GBG67024.1 hypothetical protein CBR_g78803 [Chara braunii]